MRPCGNRRLALALLLFSGAVSAGEAYPPASPTLTGDVEVATAGFYRLSWHPATPAVEAVYELQASATPAFDHPRTVYTGPDLATTLTGQPDGIVYYRVRALPAQGRDTWSEAVSIEVRHHPRARALLFFALGALVFLATLALILRGAGRSADA